MLLIKKIVLFIARIIASAFASLFVALLFFIAALVFPYITPTGELSNSVMCYFFHAIPHCELSFLSLFDISHAFLAGIDNDILNRFVKGILKYLITSVPYIFTGFIALLVFKFMWNDTRPKNKDSSGDGND
jgi:hypothetical protein